MKKTLSTQAVIRIWIVEAILGNALAAWEIYGEEPGTPWHTISYWAYIYPILGWAIAAAMIALPIWWIYHFHHPRAKMFIPRIKYQLDVRDGGQQIVDLDLGDDIILNDETGKWVATIKAIGILNDGVAIETLNENV